MGNCFSDPSKGSSTKGGGQRLGSGPAQSTSGTAAGGPTGTTGGTAGTAGTTKPTQPSSPPPRALGGAGGENGDARARALAAAEERANSVSRFIDHMVCRGGWRGAVSFSASPLDAAKRQRPPFQCRSQYIPSSLVYKSDDKYPKPKHLDAKQETRTPTDSRRKAKASTRPIQRQASYLLSWMPNARVLFLNRQTSG